MAYQYQSSVYNPAVVFAMCDADLNQSEGWRLFRIMRLTHVRVLWKCLLCPQNMNLPISVWLYSTNLFLLHFAKWNRIRLLWMGIKVWCLVLMTCFCVWSRAIRTFCLVLIARNHALKTLLINVGKSYYRYYRTNINLKLTLCKIIPSEKLFHLRNYSIWTAFVFRENWNCYIYVEFTQNIKNRRTVLLKKV